MTFDPTDALVMIVIGLSGWNLTTTLSLRSRLDQLETEFRIRQETVIGPTVRRLERVEHRLSGWQGDENQGDA